MPPKKKKPTDTPETDSESTPKKKKAPATAKKKAVKKPAKATPAPEETAVTKKPRKKAPPPPDDGEGGGEPATPREIYTGPRKGSLVIVESPAKAKTIEKYLGAGYKVLASVGHVRDLPGKGKLKGEEEVGIRISEGWIPRYVVIDRSDKPGSGPRRGGPRRSTEDILKELRHYADRSERVYLATDPDREGESIAWHLEQALGLDDTSASRITFNEITKKAVNDAVAAPRAINMDLVNAQEARRMLDRVVGYKLSPLLQQKITKGLSAGRVQSVAARLIVDREREIEAFKAEEYWKITALLSTDMAALLGDFPFPHKVLAKKKGDPKTDKDAENEQVDEDQKADNTATEKGPKQELPPNSFLAELHEFKGAPFKAVNETEAGEIYKSIFRATYQISKIEQKDRSNNADPPFITSTLQQQASLRLRMPSARTMSTAQKLYEGVTLGPDGLVALITYMRTDSTRVSDDALKMVREHIAANYQPRYLPEKPNTFKSGKSAQEAHEAIRPTDLSWTPDRVRPFLEADQHRLYSMIYYRFVASQMSPAIVATTTVDIKAGEALFKARGSIEKFDGYRIVWPSRSEDVLLPQLNEGQTLNKLGLSATQHFTQPPPRYNEASLVKALEKEGIGRPSTYASIIGTIVARGYVDIENRRFKATELGKVVTDMLVDNFPRVMDVKFTSHMEEELDEIAEGKLGHVAVLNEFWTPFAQSVAEAKAKMPAAKGVETGELCPKCNRPLEIRYSAKTKGQFIGCSGYRDKENPCRYIQPREGEVGPEETNIPCPTCTLPMVKRKSRWGEFLTCTGYKSDFTGCNTVCAITEGGQVVVTAKPTTHKCPVCEKQMLLKTSKTGFYLSCVDSKCKTNIEADKDGNPVTPPETGIVCDKCNSPMIIRTSFRGPFLACSGYEKLKDILPAAPPKKELPDVPIPDTCPECGSALKLCQARGRYFLGCTEWAKTKCKGTKPISPELMEKIQAAEAAMKGG